MKINRKTLCREFQHAPAEETVSTEGLNDYLLNEMLRPALKGNSPKLSEIDFSMFEEYEIGDLYDYFTQMYEVSRKLSQFTKAVSSTEPISCRSRQFC